ncbi:phage tail tape measure protein [Rhizobium mayense]|uniref:phage tail tape measure protein n=1 Tax=Rhizobium mayense TaxID=1312184 RepID=UPI00398C3C28
MTSRTASLRLQLIDAVSGPSRKATNSLRGIDGALARLGKGGSPEIRRLVKQLEQLQRKAGSIEDFTANRRGFKDLATQMAAARSNVSRLEAALKSAAKPTAKMKADLESAKAALKSTTQAFREQGVAVRQSERAMAAYGIAGRRGISSSQQAIRNEIAKTIREMRRLDQEARKKPPKPPRQPPGPRPDRSESGGLGTMLAGGAIANQGKNIAQKSFFYAVDFNQAAEYQAALGDFKGDDRKALNRQAERIGGDTRFSNVDVVKAQTTILQRGIRDTKTIMDLTQKVTDYSLAMGVTLEEGADALTGAALSKRIDLKDTGAISKFTDFMVWMAKNGGMSNDDVSQFVKYGGAPTTGAKLPDETMAAMGMLLRRSGVRGDEAGVFARSAASKLVAPTKKGRDALAAMGIDFNKFTTVDSMNAEGIGIMMKNNFGARLTQDMKDKVKELIDNGEFTDPDTGENRSVISDSGEFTTQMSEILAPLFGGKDGKMKPQDAKALSKALSDYQKYSVSNVDATGLLNAIAASNPTLGNLNAFFTDKQGGRANMIFQQWPVFQELLAKMQNVPGGIANKIGTEANSGLYGDWTKLTGTVETSLTRIGQDWEFATRPLINKTNDIIDGFIGLSDGTRRLIEAFGAAVAVFAGYKAVTAGTSLFGRMLGLGGGTAGGFGLGAGAMSLLKGGARFAGPVGAVITGASIASAAKPAADEFAGIMGGKYWMPKTKEDADDLRQMAEEKRQKIAEIRRNSVMPEMAATLTQPLEIELAQLEARIKAFDEINVKPNVDKSSIDAAQASAEHLKSTLNGIGGAVRAEGSGGTTATSSSGPSFGGPRAQGGPVKEGVTYPIGGRGVELFTPGADGYVTPAGQAGGGGHQIVVKQVNNIHVHGGGASNGIDKLTAALDKQLNRAAQTAFSSIRYGDK